MRDAAVGFQCPDCVRQGQRETGHGQLRFGGRASKDPRLTTFVLIGMNALVFLWLQVQGTASVWADRVGLIPEGSCAAPGGYYPGATKITCAATGNGQWVDGVATGALWQPLTSMFVHFQVMHLAMNMLTLFFLGPPLEAALGRVRFLALYLIAGIGGSAMVMWLSSPSQPTIGASGAIFGLLGAFLIIGLRLRANVGQVLLWLGLNLVFTFTVPGISWQGHLGGLLTGMAVAAVLVFAPRAQRAAVQYAGCIGVLVIAIALITVRALALG